MKQIRRSVFETNSSSTHSVVVSAGEFIPDMLSVVDGVCEIHSGEFGWGYDRFRDASAKAAYCLTWLKSGMDPTGEKEAMLINVVKRVTGAREVRFVPEFTPETKREGDYYDWGYIDHQSLENGGPGAEAFASEGYLERFIFHPKSILIIDNDNH